MLNCTSLCQLFSVSLPSQKEDNILHPATYTLSAMTLNSFFFVQKIIKRLMTMVYVWLNGPNIKIT